jgi:hypothetical protein
MIDTADQTMHVRRSRYDVRSSCPTSISKRFTGTQKSSIQKPFAKTIAQNLHFFTCTEPPFTPEPVQYFGERRGSSRPARTQARLTGINAARRRIMKPGRACRLALLFVSGSVVFQTTSCATDVLNSLSTSLQDTLSSALSTQITTLVNQLLGVSA